MSLGMHMTTVKGKRGKTKPRSEEGIFIVERRKHPRFTIELPLDYSVENKDHYGGVAVNASRGGVIVYLPVAVVVGTLLDIEIIFVKGFELNSIRARAKVVWSSLAPKAIWGEYRYGLEFSKFQEGDLPKLKALLREAGERTVDQEGYKAGNAPSALKRAGGPQAPVKKRKPVAANGWYPHGGLQKPFAWRRRGNGEGS